MMPEVLCCKRVATAVTPKAYREREVHGNAYRRPRLYSALLDETVRPPFLRDNARR